MVLHRQPDGSLKNMHIAYYPDLVLMFCALSPSATSIIVTYKPPLATAKSESSIEIPLEPDVQSLQEIDVVMHKSPTKAFDMGNKYNKWLSSCLGYDVVLAYLGPHLRPVLMSSLTKPASLPDTTSSLSGGWLSSLTSKLPTSISGLVGGEAEQDKITFADCAPYLIVSEKSMESVSARLPDGEETDIVKFRPNIIVSGADEPWEEDFWSEIEVAGAKIHCLHNCARCPSINIGECGVVVEKEEREVGPSADDDRLRDW